MKKEIDPKKQITPENLARLVKHIPMAMWISNTDGETFWLSSHWHDSYERNLPEGTKPSSGWLEGMQHEHDHHVRDAFSRAVKELKPFKCEYLVSGTDEAPRWVLNSATPSWDESGHFAGYCGAIIDISERVEARNRAESAEREKTGVVRRLAHEIRNPLSPVRTGIDLLRRSEDPALKLRLLDIMESQLKEVTSLLSDLLDVASITEEEFDFAPRRLSLGELVNDAHAERSGDFAVGEIEPGAEVSGDRKRIRQVLDILVDNAKKFGGESPPSVRVAVQGHEAILSVSDEGRGFLGEVQEAMFEDFTGDEKGATVGKGLGIGLSIARRLAELHRGSLQASSAGPNRGSTFSLRLPLAVTMAPQSQSSKILVIDDNPNIVGVLEEYLKESGHEVQIASNAEMALQIAERFRPTVCLCDIGLPGADGFSLARDLSKHQPDIALFSMSGFSDQGTIRESKDAGFLKHYVKPISVENFLEDLESLR